MITFRESLDSELAESALRERGQIFPELCFTQKQLARTFKLCLTECGIHSLNEMLGPQTSNYTEFPALRQRFPSELRTLKRLRVAVCTVEKEAPGSGKSTFPSRALRRNTGCRDSPLVLRIYSQEVLPVHRLRVGEIICKVLSGNRLVMWKTKVFSIRSLPQDMGTALRQSSAGCS